MGCNRELFDFLPKHHQTARFFCNHPGKRVESVFKSLAPPVNSRSIGQTRNLSERLQDFITYSICLWDWSPSDASFPELTCLLSSRHVSMKEMLGQKIIGNMSQATIKQVEIPRLELNISISTRHSKFSILPVNNNIHGCRHPCVGNKRMPFR